MEFISDKYLSKSQLPRVINESIRHRKIKKAISKPLDWYGRPQELKQLLDFLLPFCKTKTKCWKFLESGVLNDAGLLNPDKHLIEMVDKKESILELIRAVEIFFNNSHT